MQLGADVKARLRSWNDTLSENVVVRFRAGDDDRGNALESFVEAFSGLAPRIRFVREDQEAGDPPGLLLGASVRWLGVPEGRELDPFLFAMEISGSRGSASATVPEAVAARISDVTLPADIRIHVSSQCPFCPIVLKEIVPLAFLNPLVRVTVIDSVLFHDLAAEDRIRSVPTVIVDGTFRWTGAGHRDEILAMLLDRDPMSLGARSLEVFLEEGKAVSLAKMMMDRNRVVPAFFELLENPRWPVRLGAMVVVEEVAEKGSEVLEEILERLWNRLPDIKSAARGDILYLFGLGTHGSRVWIDRLNGLLEQESEENREVLIEAVERLKGA